ncbi:hypothetical protein BDN71DRAFT_1500313 [Pleurotus eryngii]|uniref:DRBM domain-containing protein n=1 Tax=Pleurotus eryngii TaxID=5323 RepID=A0A9P6DKD0_PLEER|nr:hypothetical protein BDN71DRAFT_1500313 [Pleurotus eryngii]
MVSDALFIAYKRAVNNWAQENNKSVEYTTVDSGPPSHVVWYCMIYVNQIPGLLGLVSASSKANAEEAAATQFWAHRDQYA